MARPPILAFFALATCAVLALSAPAHAQLGTPIDERSTVLSELVVKGPGGPPWWKVSDGDSTVFVLANRAPRRSATPSTSGCWTLA